MFVDEPRGINFPAPALYLRRDMSLIPPAW